MKLDKNRLLAYFLLFALFMLSSTGFASEHRRPSRRHTKVGSRSNPGSSSKLTESKDQTKDAAHPIRYGNKSQIRFDNQLIEGELKRPEISVVTGDEKELENGLLKLRENFLDRIATDSAGEIL